MSHYSYYDQIDSVISKCSDEIYKIINHRNDITHTPIIIHILAKIFRYVINKLIEYYSKPSRKSYYTIVLNNLYSYN